MYWTTAVPFALAALHAAVANDEEAVVNAARIAALAVAMEALSACDLHAASLLIAAPTVLALAAGTACEVLHLRSTAADPAREAAAARWHAQQRKRLRRALAELALG